MRIRICLSITFVLTAQVVDIRYGTVAKRVVEERLNVRCVLPGETDSVILTGAHFDFVDTGKGVVDNWSGASLLPTLFQSVKTVPRRHTFIFVGFTDEEKGFVGSRYYVGQLSKVELHKISAMVNLDSLGTSTTKLELDRGDKTLTNALGNVARTFKLPLAAIDVQTVAQSDSDSFQDRKVPSINIHSVTNETFPILHSPKDQMTAMHLDDYYDSYRLVAAYLAFLDQILDR